VARHPHAAGHRRLRRPGDRDGPDHVAPDDRVATFDNDGTLWCEKPLLIELAFILDRLAAMAEADGSLRERQPWRAAYSRDLSWLGEAVTKHYACDDSDVKVLLAGVLASTAGLSVDEYAEQAEAFVRTTQHPTNGRAYADCGYAPMVELLRYLEANGFTTYITSGGDRDFMRPFAPDLYSIPPERVIGSSSALQYDVDSDRLAYLAEPDVFDDRPVKPIRIWSRTGRRPLVAAGNANGDIPMLASPAGRTPRCGSSSITTTRTASSPTPPAPRTPWPAQQDSWTVVSIRNDWDTVYHDAPGAVSCSASPTRRPTSRRTASRRRTRGPARARAVDLVLAGRAADLEGRLAEAQHAGGADRVRGEHAAGAVDREPAVHGRGA
jgi:phosphoserine phosphatase